MHKRKDFYTAGGHNGRSARRNAGNKITKLITEEKEKIVKELAVVKETGFIGKLKAFWKRSKRERGQV